MKAKHFLFAFIIVSLFSYSSCKKTPTEDPHNHSLLNKTIDQIRAEIAGKWQMKRSHFYVCGIAGCNTWDTTYYNNNGDYVYFLANDTVKQTGVSGYPINIYEKASVYKAKYYYAYGASIPPTTDSIYKFEMANGYFQWTMINIINDSLAIFDGPYTYYLTR